MCKLNNNFIFFGSNVGDSLLVKFTEKIAEDENEDLERPAKRIKLSHDGASEWEGFSLNDEDDKILGKVYAEVEHKKESLNTTNKVR